MGYKCETYRAASKILNCSFQAVTQAIKYNRRIINGKPFWFEGEERPAPRLGRSGRPCLIDNVRYESVGIAARVVGSKPCALKLALETKDTFKGHSIAWVDEE